jgi:hypothetical protein
VRLERRKQDEEMKDEAVGDVEDEGEEMKNEKKLEV